MKISKINIKTVLPNEKGLIGFASFIVDGWLYIGNVAVFYRGYSGEGIRLVFPEKKYKETSICLVNPVDKESYYEIEGLVYNKIKELNN
jgi:hypothetical protein